MIRLASLTHQDGHSMEFTLCGIPKEYVLMLTDSQQPCPYCADSEELRSVTTAAGYRRSRCNVPDCNRAVASKGMCHLHYERTKQMGDVKSEKPPRARTTWDSDTLCIIPECVRSIYSRGLCRGHYVRWTKARKKSSIIGTETS